MFVKKATMVNHYHYAPEWVRLELGSKGYRACDISRLGNIIPFFPPTKDQLMVILAKRFYDNLAKKDAFSRKYGPADITDETLYKYINAMFESHVNCRGISDICETLDKSMNSFSLKSLRHFDEQLKKKNDNSIGGGGSIGNNNSSNMTSPHKVVSYPLDPPPNFLYEKIPYRNDLSQEELCKDPLLSIALNDRVNQRNIETCLQQKNPIELFGLTHHAIENPCLNVIVPIINNVNIFYYNDPSIIHCINEKDKSLKEKDQLLNEKDQSLNRIKYVIDSAHDMRQETKDLINNLITNPSTPVPLLECHKEGKRDNVKTVEVKKTNKSKDKKKEKKEKKQLKNIEISESESSDDHLKKKRKRSASTSSTPSKKVKHDRHVVHNETIEEGIICLACKKTKTHDKFLKRTSPTFIYDLAKRELPICVSCYRNPNKRI
jgi:hypothetical protein